MLTLVIGLALGWWNDHRQFNRRIEHLESTFQRIEGFIISKQGNTAWVSFGSDDGIREGDVLLVIYGATPIGCLEVINTEPDDAEAQILSSDTEISKGDRVVFCRTWPYQWASALREPQYTKEAVERHRDW